MINGQTNLTARRRREDVNSRGDDTLFELQETRNRNEAMDVLTPLCCGLRAVQWSGLRGGNYMAVWEHAQRGQDILGEPAQPHAPVQGHHQVWLLPTSGEPIDRDRLEYRRDSRFQLKERKCPGHSWYKCCRLSAIREASLPSSLLDQLRHTKSLLESLLQEHA